MSSRFLEAYNYFRSVGYTPAQSAGIVGNLHGESGLDTQAIGDGGKAFGVAQWHPNRQADFKRVFDKDIRNASYQEQLQFVAWELDNTEKKAGEALKKATDISGATSVFMREYERPANDSSLNDRIAAAAKAHAIGVTGSVDGTVSDTTRAILGKVPQAVLNGIPGAAGIAAGAGIVTDANGAVTSAFESFINWVPRGVAIIVGVALIIVAITVLLGKSDTVIDIAKGAAIASA